MFRLQDRRGNDFLLAPTHEEMFTLLVKDLYSSYKDLPLVIYQIQTKYRDEARPRAGLLRGREFVMKDSYSFDVDDAGLERSYQRHRDAYIATFERLGLPYVIVSAMSGAMGGSASEEFLAPIEVGEDTFVRCTSCDYAANVEAVRVPAPPAQPFDDAPRGARRGHARHADDRHARRPDERPRRPPPRRPRVDGGRHAEERRRQAAPPRRHAVEPLAIGVPGDRDVDMKRLEAQVLPAEPEPFGDADFAAHPELAKGYIGPGVLGEASASGIRFLVDPRVVTGTRWITGADQPGRHVVGLVAGRDFTPDGVIDVADVRPGDVCPACGVAARDRARRRDRAHLPARPALRRGARPHRARTRRQADRR